MRWKKNQFSYILWAAYLTWAGFCILALGRQVAAYFGAAQYFSGLLIGACGIVAAGILFSILRFLSEKIGNFLPQSTLVREAVQGVILICLLMVGLAFRVMHLQYAGETADYFGMARVVESGNLTRIVEGAESFYVQVLHSLYLFVGNKWIAGILLQIVLQLIEGVLCYFAVRGVAGGISGLFAVGYLMLDPACVADGLVYSPTVLYQCVYLLGFLAVTRYLKKQAEERMETVYDTLLLIFSGVLLAFVCFLDVTGLSLLAMLVCVIYLHRDGVRDGGRFERGKTSSPWGKAYVNLPVVFLSTVGFFLAFLWLDAYAGGMSFVAVWMEKWEIYWRTRAAAGFWQVGSDWAVHFVIAVGVLLGVPAFFCRKDTERISPWILVLAVLCLLDVLGLGLHLPGLIWMFGAVLAGIGLEDGLSAEGASEETVTDEEGRDPNGGFEMLENPLPMPKKHKKRVMDFAVQPDEEEMKFDYEVSDDDDFDYT